MAKAKTVYSCSECGHQERKWLGKCPACQAWSSFVEETEVATSTKARGRPQPGSRKSAKAQRITEVGTSEAPRKPLGLGEIETAPEKAEEKVCTIRTRRGADVVEIPIPCTN